MKTASSGLGNESQSGHVAPTAEASTAGSPATPTVGTSVCEEEMHRYLEKETHNEVENESKRSKSDGRLQEINIHD